MSFRCAEQCTSSLYPFSICRRERQSGAQQSDCSLTFNPSLKKINEGYLTKSSDVVCKGVHMCWEGVIMVLGGGNNGAGRG